MVDSGIGQPGIELIPLPINMIPRNKANTIKKSFIYRLTNEPPKYNPIILDTTCVSNGVITNPPNGFHNVMSVLLLNIQNPLDTDSV